MRQGVWVVAISDHISVCVCIQYLIIPLVRGVRQGVWVVAISDHISMCVCT